MTEGLIVFLLLHSFIWPCVSVVYYIEYNDSNRLRVFLTGALWEIVICVVLYRIVRRYLSGPFWVELKDLVPLSTPKAPELTVPCKVIDGYIVTDERPLEIRYEMGQWKGKS
jgi:hypothetical protein